MKRISATLAAIALASAAAVATAADSPYPTGGRPDNYSQADVFPRVDTYANEHATAPVQAKTPAYPFSVENQVPIAEEGVVAGIAGVPPYDNRSAGDAVGATR